MRGFTFIELLVSMTVVGLLSSVAVPKYIDLKRRATTTRVIGDFNTVRIAAMSFFADSGYFPAEAPAGETPANLARYLPIGFTLKRDQWILDYEYWEVGATPFSNSPAVVGVSLLTVDPLLAETTYRVLGSGLPAFQNGGTVTFIISGM